MAEDAAKKQEWEQKQQAYEASGLTATAWCKENNEKLWTFKYWRQKLRPPVAKGIFKELTDTSDKDIEIRAGQITMRVAGRIQGRSADKCLRAIRELIC